MIRYTTGDILAEDTEALINPINCVGVMGRGLALQFKKAFPENYLAYAEACKHHQIRPGHMFIVETRQLANPRYIINFPTKRHWRDNSRIEDIDAGLKDLAAVINNLGLRSIAVPALGSGLGGLEWSNVRPRIEQALQGFETLNVSIFEPSAAHEKQQTNHRQDIPDAQTSRAIQKAEQEHTMTTIINLKDRPDLLDALSTTEQHNDIVRIDRRSEWGNPFKIGQDGNREDVIKNYRQHLFNRVQRGDLSLQSLASLDGKTLACWCVPKNCHGHVLAKAAAWATTKLQTTQTQTLSTSPTPNPPDQTPSHAAQLIYAGIGSRETPKEVLDDMTRLARNLAQDGWQLNSGGALGADTAFEAGTPIEQRHVYRPLTKNKTNLDPSAVTLTPEQNEHCTTLAASLHPAWDRCSPYARLLHARNAAIVLGPNLDTPVSAVICWTRDAKLAGGTAMAMRIAQHHNIPIYNFAAKSHDHIYSQLQQIKQASQLQIPPQNQTSTIQTRETAPQLINDWNQHHQKALARYSSHPCYEQGYAELIKRTTAYAPTNQLPPELRQNIDRHNKQIDTWNKRLQNINNNWTHLTERANNISPFHEPAYPSLRTEIREFSETVKNSYLPPTDKQRYLAPLDQYRYHDHCVKIGLTELKTFANIAWIHVHSHPQGSAHPTLHPDYPKWENRTQKILRAGHEAFESPLPDHRAHTNTNQATGIRRALDKLEITLHQDQHYRHQQATLIQQAEVAKQTKQQHTHELEQTHEITHGISH